MSRPTKVVIPLALSAAVALTGAAYASAASPSSAGLMRISDNILPDINLVTPARAADASTQMSIGVSLQRPDTAAEDQLEADLYNPASPLYHHFLTEAQVAQRFGVAKSVTDSVVKGLQKAGLTVGTIADTGDYISAWGPVSAVDKAFDVKEMLFDVKGTTFIANTVAPLVKTADHVISVVGLNTLQKFSTGATAASEADQAQAVAEMKKPLQSDCTGGTCIGTTTPQDLWSVYDQPASYEGAGQRAAIIGEGNPAADIKALKLFEKTYHLPTVKLTVHCVEKGSCGTDTSGDPEWQIDTQASTGMAPKMAGEDLYFSQSISDSSINLAFLGWLDDPHAPKQASASLGECEETPLNGVFEGPLGPINGNQNLAPTGVLGAGNGEEAVLDPQLKKATLTGRTLFASAGDSGSSCGLIYLPELGAGNGVLNDGVPEVSYPAVSPSVVAVGGTVLYTTDNSQTTQRALEYGWTFGGGGTSYFEAAPPWQATQKTIDGKCISSPDGSTANTGKLCRGVPDVAAQSGDILTNGYSVCDPTTCSQDGGTSLSSPLWLGMWTRVVGAAIKPIGFAAPAIYDTELNPAAYARDFYDVTVGPNGVYMAKKGWDYVTGFGTPDVKGLIADIARHTAAK